jgi:two-component system, NtrC family, response regulator HydG
MAASANQALFVGSHPALRRALETLDLVADTDATVLVTGETGTGKELIARTLHERSSRRHARLLAVNCGALSESLLESELFGHLRGAFTGAAEHRAGKFEAADGGTLFLDEVADMPPALQVKLLRVLQTGEYAPVGSAATRHCDIRVVAATNQPLRPLVAAGTVRADLYYRLNVVCIDLPPLRERRGDILTLANAFLQQFAAKYAPAPRVLSPDAQQVLVRYGFPGNVRELENAMRRAAILSRSDEIPASVLPAEMFEPTHEVASGSDVATDLDAHDFHLARAQALDRFEHDFFVSLLREAGGIVKRAARRAGLSERVLHVKLRKHGLRGSDFRIPATRAS